MGGLTTFDVVLNVVFGDSAFNTLMGTVLEEARTSTSPLVAFSEKVVLGNCGIDAKCAVKKSSRLNSILSLISNDGNEISTGTNDTALRFCSTEWKNSFVINM